MPDTQPLDPEAAPIEDAQESEIADANVDAAAQGDSWLVTAWLDRMPPNWSPNHIDRRDVDFLVWGLERCPSTDREHFHIYFRFKNKKRMRTVKALVGDQGVWCGRRKGTEKNCMDYCLSIGKYIGKNELHITSGQFGDPQPERAQGKRSDLKDACQEIAEGVAEEVIAKDHPETYVRYYRGLREYATALKPKPPRIRPPVQVIYFFGSTGTGKSHRVSSNESLGSLFPAGRGKNPWDGYAGEETLYIDEWKSTDWDISLMNCVLDNYLLKLPARYHDAFAAWTRVVICTNEEACQTYAHESNPALRDAFHRRIRGHCWRITTRQDQGGPTFDEIITSPPDF